jgi:hypothetical protein
MTDYKKNIIIWQKWADPFGEDDKIDISDDLLESRSSYGDILEEDDRTDMVNLQKPIKVISTPMGIIPINDDTASGKIFNFWLGHTNFDITPKIANEIERTEGVETLNIFTRYRFRIAIGKAFTDSAVMNDIQSAVYDILEN